MDYYIADLHLGHKNCLTYDNRPFDSIEENDETIIRNWNKVVTADDDVYLLGDISWHNTAKTVELFNRLSGKIHLIKGNHDGKLLSNRELRSRFCEITDYKELNIGGKKSIVLCHYPIPCFKNHYHGWYHLYGHVHIGEEDNLMNQVKHQMIVSGSPCDMFNAGYMKPYMDYTPRTLEEIIKYGK